MTKKRPRCPNCGSNMDYANGSLSCPRCIYDRPIEAHFGVQT